MFKSYHTIVTVRERPCRSILKWWCITSSAVFAPSSAYYNDAPAVVRCDAPAVEQLQEHHLWSYISPLTKRYDLNMTVGTSNSNYTTAGEPPLTITV